MSIIEMEVRMDCGGCQRKIRKVLSKLEGVDTIDIDMENQKVTVSGYVDQMTVLSALRNTGKKAELWPHPPHYYLNYEHQENGSTILYSSMHAYNHEIQKQVQGYYEYGCCEGVASSHAIMEHRATTLFSDENPHACSVM